MNPPTELRPPRPERTRTRRRRVRPLHVLVVAATIATALVADRIFVPPSRIERISFENPTDYHLRIEVRGEERDGWTALGTAPAGQTKEVGEVLDVGPVWVFRFSSQGREAGDVRVERSELVGDGWRVQIPEHVGAQLRSLGAPLPP